MAVNKILKKEIQETIIKTIFKIPLTTTFENKLDFDKRKKQMKIGGKVFFPFFIIQCLLILKTEFFVIIIHTKYEEFSPNCYVSYLRY